MIAEQHEIGRARLRLGHVADLDATSRHGRRRRVVDHRRQPAIEPPGGDARVPDRVRRDHSFHQLVEMRARQAGNRDHAQAAQLRQQTVRLGAQLLRHHALVLDQVPFVEPDHDRPALALGEIGEGQILLLERDRGVEQQNDDLGEADRAQRVGDRELFQLLGHARLATQPGGVEQLQLAIAPGGLQADGIARQARLGAGQQPILAEDLVEQRGFAGVGAAQHGDAQRLGGIGLVAVLLLAQHQRRRVVILVGVDAGGGGQSGAQGVVEFAQALAVFCGKGDGFAQAQRIGVHHAVAAGVALRLVGDEDDRLVGAPHRGGEMPVARRYARAGVDDEQDGVTIAQGGLGLGAHAAGERRGIALLEAGGVDDGEFEVGQTRFALAPIAGHARLVVDQRELAPDEAVEEGRLAHVGPTDDRDLAAHFVLRFIAWVIIWAPNWRLRRREGFRRRRARFAAPADRRRRGRATCRRR